MAEQFVTDVMREIEKKFHESLKRLGWEYEKAMQGLNGTKVFHREKGTGILYDPDGFGVVAQWSGQKNWCGPHAVEVHVYWDKPSHTGTETLGNLQIIE